MKKSFAATFRLLAALAYASPAALALTPGDIAFVCFNADRDAMAFVALVTIPGNNVIRLTDTEWNGLGIGGGGAFVSGEGDVVWTAPAGGVPAGTVVVLDHFDTSPTATVGTVTGSTDLSAIDETVYAYQGGSVRQPTVFLAAIANHNDGTPDSIANTGLTAGTTALFLTNSANYAEYIGDRSHQATIAAYAPEISNLAGNWLMDVSGSGIDYLANGTALTLPGPNNPVMSVASASRQLLNISQFDGGSVSGVIADPTDPAATQGITFSLSDPQSSVLNLTAASSNQAVVPSAGLVITGTGATRTLTITPAAVGTATVTVTATDPQLNSDTYFIHYAASTASSTPAISRYHTGSSDGSTAVDVNGLMVVASDENQVIRTYNYQSSGLPVSSHDLNLNLVLPKEADLEASFRDGNRIYWIGSHGNGPGGEIEPTRHIGFSTDVNPGTGALTFVNSHNGMRNALVAWDNTNSHGLGANALGFTAGTAAGMLPTDPNGFKIEGAALTSNGNVYLGFRTPFRSAAPQSGKALLVPVTNFQTVVNSSSGTMTFGTPVFLDLGGRAIRSISNYDTSGFLILAGPAADTGPSFEIFFWDGNPASQPKLLPSALNAIAINSGGSPEALVNLQGSLTGSPTVDVLFDNGGTIHYNNAVESKDLIPNWRKFRSDTLDLANPFTVQNSADSGPGSLREMISLAPAGTTITFDPVLSGQTIILLSGHLTLAKSLVIDGSDPENGVSISGNGSSRIFEISPATTVTLSSLTLRGGYADFGGAVRNSSGTLTISGCTLTGNSAQQGGALHSDTALAGVKTTIINTTITGNSASFRGGGIYNFDGLTELVHCTITGNSAPTGDGGGVLSFGDTATQTTVRHSIIAGNSNSDVDLAGSISTNSFLSLGSNLVGTGEMTGAFNATGDRINSQPMLAPLANYGGPAPTMPPLPGSPAIDWLASATLTDQRGQPRPVDGDSNGSATADIGAAEYLPLVVTNANNSGAGSLRDAIGQEFSNYITFSAAFFNGEPADTITLASEIPINQSLVIDASALTAGVTVSGNNAVRVFNVGNAANLSIRTMAITRGNSGAGSGGGVLVSGGAKLEITNSLFANNATTGTGGGIMISSGIVTLVNSTLATNTANDGAAIWCQGSGSSVTLKHSTVSGNSGIYAIASLDGLKLENSIVAGNSAGNYQSSPAPVLTGNNLTTGNPVLALLGNYGGPIRTMPPLPGSPAIDGAILLSGTPPTDQRGASRPGVMQPDLGAVEAFPLATINLVSNDGDDIPDVVEGPGGAYSYLNPLVNDSARDTDGDGSSDEDEIGNSTNPLDPNSRLRTTYFALTELNPIGHKFTLNFTSFPGLSYAFEFSNNLNFSNARVVPLGTATNYLSGNSTLRFSPAERFVRVRRNK